MFLKIVLATALVAAYFGLIAVIVVFLGKRNKRNDALSEAFGVIDKQPDDFI